MPRIDDLISVVITNYNRCNDLKEAIASIQLQDYSPIEIIIVDNASTDGSTEMLQRDFPDITVLALNENIGMDGYSLGFQSANGEFVFQMDNDSLIPYIGVLSEVVRRFDENAQDVAVIATRVEEYQIGVDKIEQLRNKDNRTGPLNTGGFHSGGVGFRRKLLEEVGYYNRDVFLYGSELFLQMMFLAKGYRVVFYPELLMLHKSSGVARSNQGVYFELRSRYWFMRRFATPLQRLRYLPSMLIHDLVYALFKKALLIFARAFWEGLISQMPASLQPPIYSKQPDFVAKVHEVAGSFSLSKLAGRISDRLDQRATI